MIAFQKDSLCWINLEAKLVTKRVGFPVANSKVLEMLPWDFAETFRVGAEKNHGPILERLADHGGMTSYEILCAIKEEKLLPLREGGDYDKELLLCFQEWVDLADEEKNQKQIKTPWEKVDLGKDDGSEYGTYRLRLPDGWLIRDWIYSEKTGDHCMSTVIYHDPDHLWKLNS